MRCLLFEFVYLFFFIDDIILFEQCNCMYIVVCKDCGFYDVCMICAQWTWTRAFV